jgi:hypothetical protein
LCIDCLILCDTIYEFEKRYSFDTLPYDKYLEKSKEIYKRFIKAQNG